MNNRLQVLLVLTLTVSIHASAADISAERLSDFVQRMYMVPPSVPGTGYTSFNVGAAPRFYVAYPMTSKMARLNESNIYPVLAGSANEEVGMAFAVFETATLKGKGLTDCEALGKRLWESKCAKPGCEFKNKETFTFDGRSYVRYETVIKIRDLLATAFYQCNIEPKYTLSVLGYFAKPFGPFVSSKELKSAMSHILISKSADAK